MPPSVENSVDDYHISKADLLSLLRKLYPGVADEEFRVRVHTNSSEAALGVSPLRGSISRC